MEATLPAESSVRSVERTFDLLLALEQTSQPMRLSDLARTTGIHKATAQRLLGVLERRGLVERVAGHYRIGLAVVPLAHVFFLQNDLIQAASPVLQELAAATEQTISMFARLGFYRVPIHRVEGHHPLRYAMPAGQRLPLHLGAGKVLVAGMPDPEVQQMLGAVGEIRYITGETQTKEAFLSEIQQIRQQGYFVASNQRALGVISVAAPIVRQDGSTVAGISVIGPLDSAMPLRIPEISIEVRRAAQAIAQRLR